MEYTEFLDNLTEKLFSDLPYSKASSECRKKVRTAFEERYNAFRESGRTEVQALGDVMSAYGSLEDAFALAGLEPERIEALRVSEGLIDAKAVKRSFTKIRLLSVVIALLLWETFIVTVQRAYIGILVWGLPTAALLFLYYTQYKKMKYDGVRLSMDGKEKLLFYRDKTRKRLINGILVSFAMIAFFAAQLLGIKNAGVANSDEMRAVVQNSAWLITFPFILLIKNLLNVSYTDTSSEKQGRHRFRKYVLLLSGILAGVFGIALLVTQLLKSKMPNSQILLYILMGSALVAALALNFKLRAPFMKINLRTNRIRLTAFVLACVLLAAVFVMQRDVWLLQPVISKTPAVAHEPLPITYDEESGVYTIQATDGDFKILHLTDIHLGGSTVSVQQDYKALDAVYTLIEYTKPDLVLITGDLVFPVGVMSFSLNNEAPVQQFAAFMRNIGIPWAFTFGNHDTEAMATGSRDEITALYRSLSYKTSGNLLYPYTQPDITGRSNQLIRVTNPDGSVRQALFLLDSNDYIDGKINDYDYIHDDQVDWYEQQLNALCKAEGRTVPSLLFFHIPLQEYRTAYGLYLNGSDEVQYHFGEIGETMINPICCSDHPSKLFDKAVALGSTKGMFCGHDHYNNLSLTYRGIRLTYGMSIDYLAMPGIENHTAQRGAELITVAPDASFTVEQLRLTDLKK